MQIRHVNNKHWVCKANRDKSPRGTNPEILKLFEKWGLNPCTGAYLIYDKRRPVALFRYHRLGRKMWAGGTWVDPAYRRQGLAELLWKRAIKLLKPTTLVVVTTSRAGNAFVNSLKVEYPDIVWEHNDCSS